MKKELLFIGLFVTIVLISSCSPVLRPIKIKEVQGFNVKEFMSNPDMSLVIKMNNPNKVGFTMNNIKLEIYINNDIIASVNQAKKFRVKSNSDFTMPMDLEAKTDLNSYINIGKGIFSSQVFKLGVKGNISARKFIFKKEIPLDFSTKEFKL